MNIKLNTTVYVFFKNVLPFICKLIVIKVEPKIFFGEIGPRQFLLFIMIMNTLIRVINCVSINSLNMGTFMRKSDYLLLRYWNVNLSYYIQIR